ncbi:MAG: histidine kinase [Rhizobiaceae bacterium]|nr:histidine kinase [Rhizobiaceae bacterium]
MPSLIRFLVICGILAGLVYGAMFALATFVEPNPRDMTVKIPAKKINP